jgi:predicted nucleic acid-binding protein
MTVTVSKYLLDTSALLTLIEDEAGADRVEDILRNQEVFIPWLCLMEVHYITQQERDVTEANQRYALLKASGATVLWETHEAILMTAAGFKAKFRLSLADTIIAAYAYEHRATLLHKDPEYEVLKEIVTLENLPYKK